MGGSVFVWGKNLFCWLSGVAKMGKHSITGGEMPPAGRALGEGPDAVEPGGESCLPVLERRRHPWTSSESSPRNSALRVIPFRRSATPRAKRVALLFDAENVSSRYVGSALELARSEGELVIAKAYGPGALFESKSWLNVLRREGLDVHICTACSRGKNSVDMYIVADALQALFQLGVDTLVVVSSDSDFAPLAVRTRQLGKRYHGIGKERPERAYPSLCSEWTMLSSLVSSLENTSSDMLEQIVRASRESGVDEDVLFDIVKCAQVRCREKGWANMGDLANDISFRRPGFSAKGCGHSSLKKLLTKTGLFEFAPQGTEWLVRLKAA